MALGRTYTVDSGLVAIATATTAQYVIAAYTTTTNIMDIEAIRVGVFSGASISYPSNGTLLCQLQRITTPGTSGTGTLTPRPHNQADLAAATTWSTGTFQTTPATSGIVLWGQSIPLTAGANWAEWVTPGAEWRVNPVSSTGAAAYVALFMTASGIGTGVQASVEIVFSE